MKSIKYLTIASALALVGLGASGATFAEPSVGRCSRHAFREVIARM